MSKDQDTRETCDYVLSFDPGGSSKTWAYALSSVREGGVFGVLDVGFVPVVADISRPDFWPLSKWLEDLRDRHWLRPRLGGFSCDLVCERYVGRGHTGSLNESIPFHLGYWSSFWEQSELGASRLIMASQWKLRAKKYNQAYTFTHPAFENWWEDYFSFYLPTWDLTRTKSCEKHLQDACAIGWYYWNFEKRINCLPQGMKELLC